MAVDIEKDNSSIVTMHPARALSTGSSSSSSSLDKPIRTSRFAEATSVSSLVESRTKLFNEKSQVVQAQLGNVGFGYINAIESAQAAETPQWPPKSVSNVPGTPGRAFANPLSPTLREEQMLERNEAKTTKEQARDLKVKTRVRLAKFTLRGVNFSCSLIILSMISTSLSIFNATKSLPEANGLPPWASNSKTWPQKVVLACSCISLAICTAVFIGYWRGGHRRAEKVGVYYTLFAVGWFIFSTIMWAMAAGILQFTRSSSKNKDIWGWACVQNTRSQIFQDNVNYALVCQLQSWSLICICIELVVETISIMLYSVVFYRYWSKRRLQKTMQMRAKARSDLYLAQLRTQLAPNTPGFRPKSPVFSSHALSPRFPPNSYQSIADHYRTTSPSTPGRRSLVLPDTTFAPATQKDAFKLQPPPSKANPATPLSPKAGLGQNPAASRPTSPTLHEHAPLAPGEEKYDAVPIPGAYADQAVKSPSVARSTLR